MITGIVTADFNGDGKADLSFISGDGVGVMFGNGDATFQQPLYFSAGTQPQSIVVGDFNGDGRLDMGVANPGSNNVSVLLGAVAGCNFSASTTLQSFDANGGQATFVISTSSSQCVWNASFQQTYNTSAAPQNASGIGSGSFLVTIPPNLTGAPATGVLYAGNSAVTVSVAETAQIYADVPPTDYYFDYVNLLAGRGITNGCGATTFCPTLNITRAEMAVFIVRAVFGSDNFTYSSTPYFTDVPVGSFGFQWIQKLYELGITSGCGVNVYCPSENVTRAQMAVFLIRTRYGATTAFDYPPAAYFADVPAGAFAFDFIQRMREDNITAGCSPTDYCPDNPVTRGDMALFLMKGAFNTLLPPTEAYISQVSPAVLPNGTVQTFQVTGVNTHFSTSTQVNTVAGIATGYVNVLSPTVLNVDLTGTASTTPQPVSIWVTTGQEEAVIPNGLTVQ